MSSSLADVKYFRLLKEALLGNLYSDRFKTKINSLLSFDDPLWPELGLTMVSEGSLEDFRGMIEEVVMNDVPGDVLELGVWRGGCSIYGEYFFMLR